MKAKGKLIGLLTALLCIVPMMTGLFGLGDSASAAKPDMVKVTLHKKKMDDFPVGKTNTGEIDPDFENKYQGLKDVEFRPWDVTDAFYDMLKAEGITGSEADDVYKAKVKEIMEKTIPDDFNGDNSKGQPKKQPVAGADAKKTGDDGTVVFDNLPDRDTNGTYKVYWFEETKNDDNEQFGQLVLLMLPIPKVNGTGPNHDIHLYPKNKVANKPVKEILKDDGKPEEMNQDRISYDIGKEIKYRVTYQIPLHIGDIIENADGTKQTRYSKLIFKDEVTHAGVRFVGFDSMKVIGGVPEDIKGEIDSPTSPVAITQKFNHDAGYVATGTKAGFEIAMKLNKEKNSTLSQLTADWLKKYAGKTLEIVYTVQLTEDTEVDQDIKNNFYVELGQNNGQDDETERPEVTPPPVTTGGKKFVKHEKDKETETLKGAEFIITNKAGDKYLKGPANKYTWAPIVDTEYENAIKIKSGDNGLFEIKGLAYGEYKLVETKAPDGFAIGGPFDFVVSKDSYTEAASLGKIPNVSRGGFLPSTGGMGIVIFLLIGGALMAFAVTRYRKTQHTA